MKATPMSDDKIKQYWETMCEDCQQRTSKKMRPLTEMLNSKSKFKQKMAKAKLALFAATFWQNLCKDCINKIKKQIPKVGT